MWAKLEELESRYEALSRELADPKIIADPQAYQKRARAHAELEEVVGTFRRYRRVRQELAEARQILEEDGDRELRELAATELVRLEVEEQELERRLRLLLLPRDPNDEKNVIVEIRAGTGGEEAALFAADLYRMYSRYAEEKGWRVDLIDVHPTELGGFKEIVFSVDGRGAYSRLKYESGVHRVQRIPVTESGGRIHTSTATVAVLPEAEEVEVQIDPDDLRIDTFCSSGPGGQSVNTTKSAVRITHLPTGLIVTCQDEKSQHKNKEKALRVLRARLLALEQEKQQHELASARRSQVGTGDRSERIRTYNFPQGRVTDHRIGLTLHKLDQVLDGELDEIIEVLITTDQAERLKESVR
ncbi:MAG: peptide chain release factor 1 [Clostridia bacterium]|nr:peptide chain release factor 1 [Clostridia bacterium]MDH7571993.1 peptide chain release factor 1 [Clostridia bacterium]